MARNTQSAQRIAVVASLIVSAAACDGSNERIVPIPSTLPLPPSPSPSAGTLAGTVIEFTATGGRRPVPNLRLKIRAASAEDGAVGGADLPDVVTDANGRYEITDIPKPLLFVTTAPGSDHRFLCDFHPLFTSAGPRFSELPVVHVSWTGDRLPPGMSSVGTSVRGTVSERVDETLRPVAGATVTLDSGLQDPPATTSATGFYMVCSAVGTDQSRSITARKDGYSAASRQILGGWENRVDLEIGRD